MSQRPVVHRTLAFLFLLAFVFSLPGPLSLIPSVEAASPGASARIIKKLKKQIATLKKQLAAATATPAPFIEMVTVGNAGNGTDAGNTDEANLYGAVPYEYSIGKYEVTLAQYTAFLNAVAATDAFGLYSANMTTNLNSAGITQVGASPNFTYIVIGTGTRPVTFVSWFDAARFCNWLHNDRPTGLQTAATTENGAYPLNGATGEGLTISRNPGAKYWIPSEDEWYKAAYHQPVEQGGDEDNFWLYPTRSNTLPGNTIGALPLANHANFRTPSNFFSATLSNSLDSNQNYLTAVSSYPGSASFYGTFDQGGNVFEWNDAVISVSNRVLRGGSWLYGESLLRSSNRSFNGLPGSESNIIGFRVASP